MIEQPWSVCSPKGVGDHASHGVPACSGFGRGLWSKTSKPQSREYSEGHISVSRVLPGTDECQLNDTMPNSVVYVIIPLKGDLLLYAIILLNS